MRDDSLLTHDGQRAARIRRPDDVRDAEGDERDVPLPRRCRVHRPPLHLVPAQRPPPLQTAPLVESLHSPTPAPDVYGAETRYEGPHARVSSTCLTHEITSITICCDVFSFVCRIMRCGLSWYPMRALKMLRCALRSYTSYLFPSSLSTRPRQIVGSVSRKIVSIPCSRSMCSMSPMYSDSSGLPTPSLLKKMS